MSFSWCKVASNLDSHPKIRRAGRHGREVFLFALRRNAEPGNPVPGRLPAAMLEPWFIADQLMMPECDAVTGVTAAVTAGLLAIDGESYVIIGWEGDWGKGSGTGAERTARWRENKKLEKPVTGVTSHVTSPKVTASHGDGGDIEEKRREEKRTEKKEDPSGKPDPVAGLAEVACAEINRLSKRAYRPASGSVIKLCKALANAKFTPEQVVAVIASKRGWVGDMKMGKFFRPKTLLALENFSAYLDDIEAGPPLFAQGTGTVRIPSPDDDEPDLSYAGFGAEVSP